MRALSTLDRRTVLKALSLAPMMAVAMPQTVRAEVSKAGLISIDVCLVQPEIGEGPFYIAPALMRSDIAENRPGLPMALRLQVVTADCVPVVAARVDIWQCDAAGRYSGVASQSGDGTPSLTFLRGSQITDAAGIVAFQTIFPGCYPGRPTHIHYKVILQDNTVLTSQIFFDEAVISAIYEDHEAYATQGAMRGKINGTGAAAGTIAAVRMTEADGAMEAALVIGIAADGRAAGLLDWLWRQG